MLFIKVHVQQEKFVVATFTNGFTDTSVTNHPATGGCVRSLGIEPFLLGNLTGNEKLRIQGGIYPSKHKIFV